MLGEPDPSFWTNKKVLVTGAAGFAGSHLSDYLCRLGANVRCFVREVEQPPLRDSKSSVAVGDVADYPSVLRAFEDIDVGFHLAAITSISEARADVFKTFNTNAGGTLNFLMAAKERKVDKLVYVSTCQVYGNQARFPLREDTQPHPLDIYSASKLAGENLAISFAETSQLNTSISRAFNHYGPRQRNDFLIPHIITSLLEGRPLALKNPNSTRDFCYIDDIIRGYVLLAEKGRIGQAYHFCSGIERSVQDVVGTISRTAHMEPKIEPENTKATLDVTRSVGDYSKAEEELDWKPKIPFEEGIRKALDWYKSQKLVSDN